MADPVTLMNARSRLNSAPSRRWFVAQSHVHAESKAAMHLGRQDFEVYLPRYRKQRRHARRIDVVAAPLFPRYLFVSIDLGAQRWHSIQSTIGITRLVGNGDEPGMVSPEIIEGLRDREDADGFVYRGWCDLDRGGSSISYPWFVPVARRLLRGHGSRTAGFGR